MPEDSTATEELNPESEGIQQETDYSEMRSDDIRMRKGGVVQNLLTAVVDNSKRFFSVIITAIGGLLAACTGGKSVTINSKRYVTKRLIAEGGFSFVYLVQEQGTSKQFALKKVLAQSSEQYEEAVWETEVHNAFNHENLLPLLGHQIRPLKGGGHEFHMLMPLYPYGSLHDRVVSLMQKKMMFPEMAALKMFRQVLDGIAEFHKHSPAWAHRDIKPANILLKGDDTPVLMDFGSTAHARRHIKNRQEALLLQEDAAQNCSMPYRAPELFDVPRDFQLDERTDIWSLGCTLYAMFYYYSPFECTFVDGACRVADCSYLRVIAGVQFPKPANISQPVLDLILRMTAVDHNKRPFVHELIPMVDALLQGSELPPSPAGEKFDVDWTANV